MGAAMEPQKATADGLCVAPVAVIVGLERPIQSPNWKVSGEVAANLP